MQTSSSDSKHAGFIIRPQTWIFEICTGSHVLNTAWKVSKYGVFSGPYFPHSDWIRRNTPYLFVFSPNAGKCGPEKTQYLDTFHAVRIRLQIGNTQIYCRQNNQVIKPIRMKKHGCKYFMEETNRFFLFTLV